MFRDRNEAGAALAEKLVALAPENPLVLALPRGGVPVAIPIARALGAPLDLLMVRKLGMPGNPELAAGAVVDGAGHDVVFNIQLLRSMGLREEDFAAAISQKLSEIEDRRRLYLEGRTPMPVAGKSVIVVDDGIATGATVKAALKALRSRGTELIILAVPVAPQDTLDDLAGLADKIVCLEIPPLFYAVGAHYRVFDQVEDAAVQKMLRSIWSEQEK
jgi:putative phosphoribosyl transferase